MATCAHCKKQETELYENGVPICIACATDKAVERASTANDTGHSTRTFMPTPDPQSRD